MLRRSFQLLLCLLAARFQAMRDARIRLLLAQLDILKRRLSTGKIIPSPEERALLLGIGAECNHAVKDVLTIVTWHTYRRWLREAAKGRAPRRVGRPRLSAEICELVVRFARENLSWGFARIAGEMRKLGRPIGCVSVKRILQRSDIPPTSVTRRKPPVPWDILIKAHMDSLVACDFFTKIITTWRGRIQAYALVFIHYSSRRVLVSPPTFHPDEAWVMQQARNAALWMEDEGIAMRFFIHDNDSKLTARFTSFFRDIAKPRNGDVIKTAFEAPNMNAFSEAWIGRCKAECLNHFFCFQLDQFDHILQEYARHYNTERPHQGKDIGNRVLDPNFVPQQQGNVMCKESLGGLLKSYYRSAS